jgi:hypothetical protein
MPNLIHKNMTLNVTESNWHEYEITVIHHCQWQPRIAKSIGTRYLDQSTAWQEHSSIRSTRTSNQHEATVFNIDTVSLYKLSEINTLLHSYAFTVHPKLVYGPLGDHE